MNYISHVETRWNTYILSIDNVIEQIKGMESGTVFQRFLTETCNSISVDKPNI